MQARRRGVKFGQPPKTHIRAAIAMPRWKKQGLSVREIVKKVKSEFGITISHGGGAGLHSPEASQGQDVGA